MVLLCGDLHGGGRASAPSAAIPSATARAAAPRLLVRALCRRRAGCRAGRRRPVPSVVVVQLVDDRLRLGGALFDLGRSRERRRRPARLPALFPRPTTGGA